MDEKNARNLLDDLKRYRRAVIYGAGRFGRITRTFLHENGIDILCFLQTDMPAEGVCLGVPVYQAKDYDGWDSGVACLVCGGSSIQPAMQRTLMELGVMDFFVVDERMISTLDAACTYTHRFPSTEKAKILLFHRVACLERDVWQINTPPKVFAQMIRYLCENYRLIHYEETEDCRDSEAVAITFDDGYVDNYRNALPVLEVCRAPATFFVSTGHIGKADAFWWDALANLLFADDCPERVRFEGMTVPLGQESERLEACRRIRQRLLELLPEEREARLEQLASLTGGRLIPDDEGRTVNEAELKTMSATQYITIGAHTVTHSRLTSLPPGRQLEEVNTSRETLEALTGTPVQTFSYPFGQPEDYDKLTMDILQRSGFQSAAAITPKYSEPELRRYNHKRVCAEVPRYARDIGWSVRRLLTVG